MSGFLQLHYLTVYPLSNPNRDDLGRPKTAVFGGANRLRISSQSLKRAARLSDALQGALAGHMGDRTQRIGEIVRRELRGLAATDDQITTAATQVADVFGKLDAEAAKKNDHIRTRQLAFISPDEREAAIEWAKKAAGRRRVAQHQGSEEGDTEDSRRGGRCCDVRPHAGGRPRLQP